MSLRCLDTSEHGSSVEPRLKNLVKRYIKVRTALHARLLEKTEERAAKK